MSIGRRIIGSISGLLVLLMALLGTGIGAMAWLRSWHDGYVEAAQQAGALTDPGLQHMLSSLDTRAAVVMIVMAVIAALFMGLGVAALVRLGPTVDRKLKGAVASISSSVAELLAVASEVAAATAQTAAATNETTATVEEVKQTAFLAQEKAAEASELAHEVVQMSKVGVMGAEKNYGHFEEILADMDEVARAIVRLNEHTQAVSEVMVTVNDLAEQSNLLSVNASIEAYKSGEAGKGFTVVAQEVKNLATQSKQAVARVRDVLSGIKSASSVVVRAAEQAREAVDLGRSVAVGAIQNINERVLAGDRTAEATMQISVASRQQLAGMEQIALAVASITEASSHSEAGMRQMEGEVERLRELADGLDYLVKMGTKKAG
jgi:methyl-accepting chemotaxis protein